MRNIFALDVGTRNVVGCLFDYTEDGKIVINHARSIEHETRAMEDGQIQDIDKVAKVVGKIKKEIEEESETEINEVSVAVAGRVLITEVGSSQKKLHPREEITHEMVLATELEAIQNSTKSLTQQYKDYHCAGYTVSAYKLDGEEIKNPEFQKGKRLEIEILATFLPKIVIDSMFTMAERVGLKIRTITLEPIASISVVIPEDMRKLNLALVDIGAGTSDIAITKQGKISGYGMVPMAGDEITEVIANEYVLDFSEAEKLKRKLQQEEDTVKISDVLGMEYEVEKIHIIEKIKEKASELARNICDRIIEINGKATQAVMLIGGGSQTPYLREQVVADLSLSDSRVAIRNTDVIKNLVDNTGIFTTSEFITPIGIANMSVFEKGLKILSVDINDETYRIFSFEDEIKVLDALLSSGVSSKELQSNPGIPLTITINGKIKIVKGEMGKESIIKVNSKKSNLDEKIKDGDNIDIKKQRDGRDAVLRVRSLRKYYKGMTLNINGETFFVDPKILINGETKDEEYFLRDRDDISIKDRFFVRDIFDNSVEEDSDFKFFINSQEMDVTIPAFQIKRGDVILSSGDEVFDNENLIKEEIEKPTLKISDFLDVSNYTDEIFVEVNGQKINLGKVEPKIIKNNHPANIDTVINYNDQIEIFKEDERYPMVSDIFKQHEPEDFIQEKGGMLQIEVNGQKAEFITRLKNNDIVRVYYSKNT